MPGVVDADQARRTSKAIDDDIKVALLACHTRFILLSFIARKREDQEKAETKQGGQGCVLSLPPLFLFSAAS
jgi:hypothetical protein